MSAHKEDISTAALIKAALDLQRELGFETAHSFLLNKGVDATLAEGLLGSCKNHGTKGVLSQIVDLS